MHNRLPPIPWYFELSTKLKKINEQMILVQDEVVEIIKHMMLNISSKWHTILAMQDFIERLERDLWINRRLVEHLKTENYILHKHISGNKRCECCFNIVDASFKECTSGHRMCSSCLNSWCKVLVEKKNKVPQQVECCAQGGCDGYIEWSDVSSTEHGMELLKERHVQEFIPLIADILSKNDKDALLLKLPFMKSDGKSYAAMCPNCGYGPLLHDRCDDLVTHHGENLIDNSCPNCGTLTEKAYDLLDYDT